MKTHLSWLPLALAFMWAQCALGNTQQKDSLFKALKNHTTENATRADILNSIAQHYDMKDFNKSYEYACKAEKLSEKIGYDKGYYKALTHKADAVASFGKPEEAIKLYKKIIVYDKKMNDRECMAVDYNHMSTVYSHMGKYQEALTVAFKSLRLYESLRDIRNQALNLNMIAGHYYSLNKYSQAKKYIYSALELLHHHPDDNLQAYCYMFMSACFNVDHKFDSATVYLNKAIAVYEKIQNLPGIITANNNACELLLQLAQVDSAYMHAQRAVLYAKKLGSTTYLADGFKKIAACYLAKTENNLGVRSFNYQMSLAYLDSAQLNVSPGSEDQMYIYHMRSVAHKVTGRYDSALLWYEKFKVLSDSIYYSQQDKNIEELNVSYQVEKKEQQNKALQQKTRIQTLELERGRYQLYGILALAIIVALISFLLIRQNRIKSNQRTLQVEQKLLRSQMNPHFIFNSLTSIESFIYSNHPKEAGRYLSDFARLMRLILENSREEEITLEKEIKTLQYYLSMQQLRMEDRLSFNIEVDDNLNQHEVMVPPMLTQPFIENAIEHGIPPNEKGMIHISYKKQNDMLVVQVTDNGLGISHSIEHKLDRTGHKSMALEITRERLDILKRSRGKNYELNISDLKTVNQRGTSVTISLPV